MPGLARKVIICAAVDGLVLQPLNSKKDQQRPLPLVRIKYGDASITSVSKDAAPDISKPNASFEAFGIVGLLTVFRYSYLISITRRQQVAQIHGLPIYVVTEVGLTPCSSQQDASIAIAKTAEALSTRTADLASDDSSSDSEIMPEPAGSDEVGDDGPDPGAEAQWSTEAVDDNNNTKGDGKSAPKKFPLPSDAAGSEAAISLLPKLLRTAQIFFGSSRTFYFSYDYDITRSLANSKVPATALVPLYNHVDPRYFWNSHIIQPFVDAGMDGLVLPLMQGFVGQRSFVVDSNPPQTDSDAKHSVELSNFGSNKSGSNPASPPPEKATADIRPSEKKFDITVISRRSIKRAGLRYLRRGIDEEGNVANNVETEQILSPADATWDPGAKVCSFVQIRGSFPLFFTQSPYSLKPAPVMQHSADANFAALKKHFDALRERYGSLQIVNLVEKHGVEARIGEEYEKNIQRLNEESVPDAQKVAFEWFDFHSVCRGMKFENVAFLLQILGSKLEGLGSTVSVDNHITAKQTGVLRTNCMDCLDRTNVCQSSFAKHMVDMQLKEQGFDMGMQKDQENAWFNTLWADNGDAISKQYASTGAMKGDYTRTRKRNYRGALTDAGLSLTRLFNGMFNDFFLQTTIDFLLGNVTSFVFEEFEANMMTKDPAVSMQKMREQAIELCQKRVVEDEAEEFIGGWTFLTPRTPNTVRSASFEEVVLLLTDVALYLCRFDWNLDKVSSFERVDLAHVQKIKFGTYITSTISPAHVDEIRNVGLLIEYKPGSTDIVRVNTRSISSMSGKAPAGASDDVPVGQPDTAAAPSSGVGSGIAGFLTRRPQATTPPSRKIALKALNSQTSVADPMSKGKLQSEQDGATTHLTEIQQVVVIAAEIERLAIHNQPRLAGKKPEEAELIEKGDIISLTEAKRNTGLLEQLGHSIKKLVWA